MIITAGLVMLFSTVSRAAVPKAYTGFHPGKRDSVALVKTPQAIPVPLNPNVIFSSPGRVVGTTYFDFQANGSTGNRIVLDNQSGVHYCWTGSPSESFSPRSLYYGFISSNGDSLPAVAIPGLDQAGFCNIDVYNGSVNPSVSGDAILGYHNSLSSTDWFGIESSQGTGNFVIDSTSFPEGAGISLWPSFSVDINDNIQAVATQSNTGTGGLHYHIYSRKPYGSSTWATPIILDTTYNISPVITSSPVSAKSAIAWTSPIFQEYNQYDNNVMYLESTDGLSWNVASGRVNITNYPQIARGDTTLRAYTDVDAVYDYANNLHIIWNAAYVTHDSADEMIVLYHSALFHWSQATGINIIYDHPVREWPCDMGAWNLSISKMSIGVDADSNFLYVTFTRFDPNDYASFDSLSGTFNPCGGDNSMPCGNGDIFMTWSRNNGNTWATPVNLTNSPSPGCLTGECDNDNWSSLAERVDDYLHIIFIDDKDAGGAVIGEGNPTENPVIYLKVPNPTRTIGGDCQYVVGDINNSGRCSGVDVVYGVNYLKGGAPPDYQCICSSHGLSYAAGDVNGSCSFNALDITYLVNYFKGGLLLAPCPDCPPGRR
jgi:hypothetical protein